MICWLAGPVATAQPSKPFLLSKAPSAAEMRGHVDYYLDHEQVLGIAEAASAAFQKEFNPLETKTAEFGYTKAAIWLRFSVKSLADFDEDWRLHFRENFLQVLELYQLPPQGAPVLLEQHRPDTPFSARSIRYPELVVAFTLLKGETQQFFLKYRSGGSSQLAFTIRSAQAFDALAARKTAKNFIYYGMLLLLILIAFVSFLATQQMIFAAYSAYAGFGLLFIMHADGNAFQYLWPGLPLFNGYSSILLGSGLIASGANFTRLFLATRKYHPWLDRILLALIFGEIALVVSTVAVDTQLVKKTLVLLALAGTILFTVSGLIAARTRFKEVRFFVVAWTGAVISSGIMTSRHWLGIGISEEVQFDSMRIVFVLDAALMGAAILDRFNQLRQARADALQLSLSEAERNLWITRCLRDLEARCALALKFAESSNRRIADTVHDLRQPLHALRLNIQHMMDGQNRGSQANTAGQIEETFTYLENLVSQKLDRSVEYVEVRDTSEVPDTVAMEEVIRNVQEMFAPEAADKGVTLRSVTSHGVVALPPLDVMRIVTNLVSNGIKYTQSGKVLFGMRRRNGALWLDVYDMGSGLSQDALEQMRLRNVRGEAAAGTEGHGLGLSIVQSLVEKHGLRLRARLLPEGGSCISVLLDPAPL